MPQLRDLGSLSTCHPTRPLPQCSSPSPCTPTHHQAPRLWLELLQPLRRRRKRTLARLARGRNGGDPLLLQMLLAL